MTRTTTRACGIVLLAAFAACGDGADATPTAAGFDAAPAADVALRVHVQPREVGLLQPVTVTVDRYRRDGVEVRFDPAVDDERFVTESTEVADEVPIGGTDEAPAGWSQRTTLRLLPVAGPGEVQVPEFRAETVVADGAEPVVATATAPSLTVSSTLDPEHGDDIEAPGEPIAGAEPWWPAALGASAAVLLLWWLFSLTKRRREVRHHDEVAAPPHILALRELRRWRDAPRRTPDEIAAFYVGVSQVLREYVEARFDVRAPERTTEEFLRDIEGSDHLVRQNRDELERFLSQCDLVKFAAVVPSEHEHVETWQIAERFVEATRGDRELDRAARSGEAARGEEVAG